MVAGALYLHSRMDRGEGGGDTVFSWWMGGGNGVVVCGGEIRESFLRETAHETEEGGVYSAMCLGGIGCGLLAFLL